MEGVEKEAAQFGEFLADEGAEQCGFCSPGFIMNVLAMARELQNPTLDEIKKNTLREIFAAARIYGTASRD